MKEIATDLENRVLIGIRKYEYDATIPEWHFNPHSDITSIAVDADNLAWYGTNTKGVYRYDGSELINFTMADGLASNAVYDVVVDMIT
jgi:ligand-binding sensor domain-containing protein